MDELHMWEIGILITVCTFAYSIWYRAVRRNDEAHRELHKKLDLSFNTLRDKIEELWKRGK